jgi:N-acetylglucosaminyl-diphospho-decaprenol L-rhamnosyltransferase
MQPTLDIVIVNWNTGDALRRCVKSIGGADRTGLTINRLVIVDNASTDGSCERLDVEDLPITIQRNAVNRGFAAACNQGAAGSTAEYFLFLNPDTMLFRDSLTRPIEFMEREQNRTVGICGVRLVDDTGRQTISCARFPTAMMFFGKATGLSRLAPKLIEPQLMSATECRVTRVVDQTIGAFFLVRRELFEALGGFDERFFVYFEEVDFAICARRRGYASVFLAEATACHSGSVSSSQVKAVRLFYSLRSRLIYGRKHYSWVGNVMLWAVTFGVEFPMRLGRALLAGSVDDTADTARGYQMLAADLLGRRQRG